MSDAAERARRSLPPEWERLERAAEEAAVALDRWIRRAKEAEGEVARLRLSLEELAGEQPWPDDLGQEVRRLKAENTALRSRMAQARRRVARLTQRLATLGIQS